ncbi:RVP_2 domain-containing protein [Gossypium australe]|uniref:RVP_2 domain-containing protein n=1 Tax=Gossypium australe TaxID=47621 RepID=A0A5B6VC28_9ROSI|nr:RVP_2 domain-containing protein [Gossypium australe]
MWINQPETTAQKGRKSRNNRSARAGLEKAIDITERSEARAPTRAMLLEFMRKLLVQTLLPNVPTEIKEFVNVLLEELPVIKIELVIELSPGTTSILISLYRMAPTELKDLKT